MFVGDNSTSLSGFAVADLYGNRDTQLLTYGQIIGDEAYRKRNLSFFPYLSSAGYFTDSDIILIEGTATGIIDIFIP